MGKKVVSFFIVCLTITFFAAACCPKNPPLNSVRTAHGNTDWHIDTAEEFLTGVDTNGTNSAANHCPDTWSKNHMHVGSTNTNEYYYDSDVFTGGKDVDSSNGIDKPMLFFYAGHGSPTGFNTLGNSADLTNMRLGNCKGSNNGTLRYYWQCSCEVFAHGPKNCTGSTEIYSCPQDFDGSSDSDSMRNVYERWGPTLNPALRMACGSSTLAYCHETETNKIWDNYNNRGFDVADSFIDGLHRYSWNTPLCITTGGLFVSGTPLFDAAFTNAANPSGPYYHIQYLSNFDTTAPDLIPVKVPELLPIYELIPPPLPDPYRNFKFQEKGEWMHSSNMAKERGIDLRVNRNSGAVYLSGERKFDEKAKPLNENEYVQRAERLIGEQGWLEEGISKPRGTRMTIQRVAKDGKRSDINSFLKNVVINFKRRIKIDGDYLDVIGVGGVISVQLNGDGSLRNASKVWRKIKSIKKTTKAKKYEQAYDEAIAEIKGKNAYKLLDWTLGYDEAAGNVRQNELRAFYLFNFVPVDQTRSMDYPPRIVTISAHIE